MPAAQPVTRYYAPQGQRSYLGEFFSPRFRRTVAKIVFALTLLGLAGYICYRAYQAYTQGPDGADLGDVNSGGENGDETGDETGDVKPARQITQSESMQRAIRDAAWARAAADEQTHTERLQSESAADAEAAAIAQQMLETELTSYQRSALHGLEN